MSAAERLQAACARCDASDREALAQLEIARDSLASLAGDIARLSGVPGGESVIATYASVTVPSIHARIAAALAQLGALP